MIEKLDLSIRKPTISAQSFDRSRINEIEGSLADLQILSRKLERTELTRQQTAKDLLNSIKTKITVAKYSVNNGERSKKEASKIVAELKTIKDNTCPTCDRSEWITDNIKVKESELLQAFESHKALILAGVSAAQEIVTLEESLAQASNDVTQQPILELIEINKKESELKSELNGLREIEQAHTKTQSSIVKKANDEYLVKVNELSQKQSAELSAINKQISEAKQELTHAENDYKTAEMSAKKYQDTKDMLLCQRFAKEVTLEKAEKALVELKEKVEIVQEAKLLVKSFISCSFDDALISIGDKATSIIRGIPNMATATIQLEGMRETKEGKTKEEVTAVLSVDGEQNVPIKSLSGGERSSVDLAIDLAVIDFLESSTGKGCNFMVLDEPFGGLDSVSIESILELLQSSNLNKKLIIVDHNEIIKEYVQNKIMVTREGDFSTVEVL
jgi:DNA repair exonuclease SbcCD ATPase subunit